MYIPDDLHQDTPDQRVYLLFGCRSCYLTGPLSPNCPLSVLLYTRANFISPPSKRCRGRSPFLADSSQLSPRSAGSPFHWLTLPSQTCTPAKPYFLEFSKLTLPLLSFFSPLLFSRLQPHVECHPAVPRDLYLPTASHPGSSQISKRQHCHFPNGGVGGVAVGT